VTSSFHISRSRDAAPNSSNMNPGMSVRRLGSRRSVRVSITIPAGQRRPRERGSAGSCGSSSCARSWRLTSDGAWRIRPADRDCLRIAASGTWGSLITSDAIFAVYATRGVGICGTGSTPPLPPPLVW